MAAETFGEIWRELRLYCPFVPIPLAQHWVRDRYRKIFERGLWAAAIGEGQFLIPNPTTAGTAQVTTGSTAVVGNGTAWTSALVGQQFYVGNAPFYTVASVADATDLTLDQAYGGTSSTTAAYTVSQVYLTPPSDFLTLIVVRDPINNWRLRLRVGQDQLDRWDANRTTTGTPWVMADYKFDANGVPRYELWPRRLAPSVYPFLYYKRPSDLALDSDRPVLPIRGDALKFGALADLAMWPGTTEQPNPMFDVRVHQMYEMRYLEEVNKLGVRDQEIYSTDVWDSTFKWANLPEAPIDARFLQAHDVMI